MNWEDFLYSFLMLLSVLCGPLLNKISNTTFKRIIFAFLGILGSLIVCGNYFWHSFISVAIGIFLIKIISTRHVHIFVFICVFGYLAFFHTIDYWGFPVPSSHCHAVQLLITLRIIGVAFEIHDSSKLKKKVHDDSESSKLEFHYRAIKASSIDIFMYSYCYTGLLTGPYFKYRTYDDMIQQTCDFEGIPNFFVVSRKIAVGLFYGLVYLGVSYFFSIEDVWDKAFYERGLTYRISFMVVMFVMFRCRVYFAWIVSECICMVVGLGAYPMVSKPRCGHGPTDLLALDNFRQRNKTQQEVETVEYNYETIHNIDVYGCEMAPTVREGMKAWNMSVQYWLASCVYRRISSQNRTVRTAITMAVSAYWHGVHPGYYLSFLTIPLCLAAESTLERLLNRVDPTAVWSFWPRWFFKMRSFDYMCMGFLIRDGSVTLRYWYSTYWCVHTTAVVILLLGSILLRRKSKKDNKCSGEVQSSAQTAVPVH